MENKEQLMESLKNLIKEMEAPVLSEEEVKTFKEIGLTDKQIKELEETVMVCDSLDVLPDDEEGLNKLGLVLRELSKGTGAQKLEKLKILAEKDPKMFAQVAAISTAIEQEILPDAE